MKKLTIQCVTALLAASLLISCDLLKPQSTCTLDEHCPAGMTCAAEGCVDKPPADPICTSHAYSLCEAGDAVWFDSCDRRQELRQSCGANPCVEGECQLPTCNDGLRNGGEADVDCAGSCPPCGEGRECLVHDDCASRSCINRRCEAASCEDAIQNAAESDVDCGGPCSPCGLGKSCTQHGDCESNTCEHGRCIPSFCTDGATTGFETDVDCGGPDCDPCDVGAACQSHTDCQSRECSEGTCAPLICPEGMVRIGTSASCVDPYEATVFSNPSCTGQRYGLGNTDDFPAGFPDNVSSRECEGTCEGVAVVNPTVSLYACSVAGVRPSANVTWFQARRACEDAGKHLCSLPGEWRPACYGDPAGDYPYGDAYMAGRCNDGDAEHGGSAGSGAMETCHGRGFASSVYDMSGNIWEWTATCPQGCLQAGGGFSDILDYLSCDGGTLEAEATYSSPFLGFRCCWTPQDEAG